jgi:hypothetical protein
MTDERFDRRPIGLVPGKHARLSALDIPRVDPDDPAFMWRLNLAIDTPSLDAFGLDRLLDSASTLRSDKEREDFLKQVDFSSVELDELDQIELFGGAWLRTPGNVSAENVQERFPAFFMFSSAQRRDSDASSRVASMLVEWGGAHLSSRSNSSSRQVSRAGAACERCRLSDLPPIDQDLSTLPSSGSCTTLD